MGRNRERDERELAARKLRIVRAAFPIFAERTIEGVTMNEIAAACGMGVATLYRHYPTKPELVLAVATWAWQEYLEAERAATPASGGTAAEGYAYFLELFVQMYRERRDLLRFNQFFNAYVQTEHIGGARMEPYMAVIASQGERFRRLREKAERDGTMRTDLPAQEIFATSLHLMLAAATRYAVGLVYRTGDPEQELELLRAMLLQRFTTPQGAGTLRIGEPIA